MLYRKIARQIEELFTAGTEKILLIDGARQVGKTFIVRHVGKKLFPNFVELNFLDDKNGERLFENVRTIDSFYLQISAIAGSQLGRKEDTIIFLDEIQAETYRFYAVNASQYDLENKLKIRRIYDLIPSNMENKRLTSLSMIMTFFLRFRLK